MQEQKYIALIDCDCFFVSCERRFNPDLKDKAVCVVSGERGCVISRSKEAKDMGIPMGQPLFMAKEQFPNCIYINANHSIYAQCSDEVMAVLKELVPKVEVYSIDEAFADLTGLAKFYKKNYYQLAKFIRKEILTRTNIPVSIGVSRSKTLAKLASDKSKNKASHICIVGKQHITGFLKSTDVSEVWGIGRKISSKLGCYCIHSAFDYVQKNDVWLKTRFGKNGLEVKYELLGNLINKVSDEVSVPKSISDTKSFPEFTSDYNYLKNELMIHIHNACRKLRQANCNCFEVGLILKTKDFQTYYLKTESKSSINFEFEVSDLVFPLLKEIYNPSILYRSIGISLNKFIPAEKEQLTFFDNNLRHEKNSNLAKSLDKLETKFGKNIIKIGFTGNSDENKQDYIIKN